MYYVYILILKNGNLYKRVTSDLRRRINEHKRGKIKSTKHRRPIRFVHYEAYLLKTDAQRREKFLKTTEGKRLLRRQIKDVLDKAKAGSPGHTTRRPVA